MEWWRPMMLRSAGGSPAPMRAAEMEGAVGGTVVGGGL